MRYLTVIVLAAIVIAALLFTWTGLQPQPGASAARAIEEPPRYVLSGAEWTRLDRQGQPEFRAYAKTVEYYADDSIRLNDVTMDSLGGNSSPWRLTSPSGVAPPHEHRLKLDGPVVAQGTTGDGEPFTITTDDLWVDQLRRELYTDAPVKMAGTTRNATAVGLRADFSGEHVRLLNDVKVDYAPAGG